MAAQELKHLISDAPRVMVADGSKLVRKLIADVLARELPGVQVVGCASIVWVRPIGYVFAALFAGYVFAVASDVIAVTATGRDDLPDWPDAMDLYDDMFKPLLAASLLGLLAFGPCGIAAYAGGPWWTTAPLALIGVVVFSLDCAGLSQGGGAWSSSATVPIRCCSGRRGWIRSTRRSVSARSSTPS